MTNKNPSNTLFPWLKANLGKQCLAPLTGTDARALRAAVLIVELWQQCDAEHEAECFTAFAAVVTQMQHKCWELAYHSIAHVAEWSTRLEFWMQAGLELPPTIRRCAFES